MDLNKFVRICEEAIVQYGWNLVLSGAAEVTDLQHLYWSASFEVVGQGQFPEVEFDLEKFNIAKAIFQRDVLTDLKFSKLQGLKFKMQPDKQGLRWQCLYLFRA